MNTSTATLQTRARSSSAFDRAAHRLGLVLLDWSTRRPDRHRAQAAHRNELAREIRDREAQRTALLLLPRR